MKLIWVVVVYLLFALLLGWGILLTVHGKPWLLIVGTLIYTILLGKLGCLPKKSHG